MFGQDALLLVGHGSTSEPDAARALLAHAEVIRASGRFATVSVGMLYGEPGIASAFRDLAESVVHVVPFFLEDGFFTRVLIPELLLPRIPASRLVTFSRPLGTHDEIAVVIEARLTRHCEMFGIEPASLSILLIGHGSSRNPGQAHTARRHAAQLEKSGRFAAVRLAYLEEAPFAADILAATRGHVVAVVGYLLNQGVHAARDLPRLISEERAYRGALWPPIHDIGTIGADPVMPRLLIDLVSSAA